MKTFLIILMTPISLFSQNIFESKCDSIKFKFDDIEFGRLAKKVFLNLIKEKTDTLFFFYEVELATQDLSLARKKKKALHNYYIRNFRQENL